MRKVVFGFFILLILKVVIVRAEHSTYIDCLDNDYFSELKNSDSIWSAEEGMYLYYNIDTLCYIIIEEGMKSASTIEYIHYYCVKIIPILANNKAEDNLKKIQYHINTSKNSDLNQLYQFIDNQTKIYHILQPNNQEEVEKNFQQYLKRVKYNDDELKYSVLLEMLKYYKSISRIEEYYYVTSLLLKEIKDKKHGQVHVLGEIYYEVANLYTYFGDIDKAKEYYLKSLQIKNKELFDSYRIKSKIELAKIYTQTGESDSAKIYYYEVIIDSDKNNKYKLEAVLGLADNLINAKNYSLCIELCRQYIKKANEEKEIQSELYHRISISYLGESNLTLSLQYADSASKGSNNLEILSRIYLTKSKIYEYKKDYYNSNIYKDSVIIVNNQILQDKSTDLMREMRINPKKPSGNKSMLTEAMLTNIVIVLLLILLVVISLSLYRKMLLKKLKMSQQEQLDTKIREVQKNFLSIHEQGSEDLPKDRETIIKEKVYDLLFKEKVFKDARLTRQEFIQKLGINQEQLNKTFNQMFGQNYSTCINKLRVEEASVYLLSSDLSISEISIKCGFGTEKTFRNQFYKEYKVNPKKYKRTVETNKRQHFLHK